MTEILQSKTVGAQLHEAPSSERFVSEKVLFHPPHSLKAHSQSVFLLQRVCLVTFSDYVDQVIFKSAQSVLFLSPHISDCCIADCFCGSFFHLLMILATVAQEINAQFATWVLV